MFCKIVEGEIPTTMVLDTKRTLAFRDLRPVAPTHVLVIPKQHIEHAGELHAEHADLLVEMVTTAQAVAAADGIAEGGYRLVLNVGDDAGNSVAHLHLHVIGGRSMGWPPF